MGDAASLDFLGAPKWFYIAKSVFLAFKASLAWLNNVVDVY